DTATRYVFILWVLRVVGLGSWIIWDHTKVTHESRSRDGEIVPLTSPVADRLRLPKGKEGTEDNRQHDECDKCQEQDNRVFSSLEEVVAHGYASLVVLTPYICIHKPSKGHAPLSWPLERPPETSLSGRALRAHVNARNYLFCD